MTCEHDLEHCHLGYTEKQFFIDGKWQGVFGRYIVKKCKKCGELIHFDDVEHGHTFYQEHRSGGVPCPYKNCPFCNDQNGKEIMRK